jgi:hypothetical protein
LRPDEQIFSTLSRKLGFVIGIASLLVFAVAIAFADEGQALAAGASTVALLTAGALSWPLRRRAWFWLTMAGIAAVHAWVVLAVRWGEGDVSATTLVPIMWADTAVIIAVVWTLSRLIDTSRG